MYCSRDLSTILERALGSFPAVLITGPRQSGKTTFLLQEWHEGARYVSFDDPLQRQFAREDPNTFLDQFGEERAILDEIQYVPELFQYLKIRIDRERHAYGRWLLTGSQQFALMANVSESLAGRIAILELLPFSLVEAAPLRKRSLAESLWIGAFPEPSLEPGKRDLWLSGYLRTYVERDVRQLRNIQDLRAFDDFLALCASRHSQVLAVASLARDLGFSQPTIKTWAGVLQAGYVVHLLPPFYENFGKRVTKRPKLYFLDPSLACALTRQPDAASALAGAMGGALFEGWVVAEAIKVLAIHGRQADLYFWRSHDGLEVDLLLRLGGRLVPIEIKLTATPSSRHLQPLVRFQALAGKAAAEQGLLVCRVAEPTPMPGGHLALPWNAFPSWLGERIATGG